MMRYCDNMYLHAERKVATYSDFYHHIICYILRNSKEIFFALEETSPENPPEIEFRETDSIFCCSHFYLKTK